jgi:outer membrane protein insertion porin family
VLFFTGFAPLANADTFSVADIRLEGLQRVSAGTLFQSFPINVGDTVDESGLIDATRSLFKTGFFDDIQLGRDGDVLIVQVAERPSISAIGISGNKVIKTDDLKEGLKQSGLTEGEIFKRATLEALEQELTRQYISQGRYGVEVRTDVIEQPRNRVSLLINVVEGTAAKIKQVNIVGNRVFKDKDLKNLLKSRSTNWLSFIRGDDKYSREKLNGDLESLRSKYLDNGYIKFSIESTQVSITPDKKNVYININITEGEQYRFKAITFAGDLVVKEDELRKIMTINPGDVFSNELLVSNSATLTDRLGDDGYTFANVNAIPSINEDTKTVDISIFIDPGKRAYVRRINFTGNTVTADEVLRREMRQQESAWASNKKIQQSKVRLERLGFFKSVNVETRQVPGSSDQLDVNYSVEEQPTGSINFSLGYSQGSGLFFGAGVSQNNFLGTGKNVSIAANQSSVSTFYNFSYLDPYYSIDGVSRGFNIFYKTRDFDEDDTSSFRTDSAGAGVTFGYPISETQTLAFRFGVESTKVKVGSYPVAEINEFIGDEGDQIDEFQITGTWRQSKLNRGFFATKGSSQNLSIEIAVPGSDLTYYRITYKGQVYFPIFDDFALKLRANLGYGDSFGSTGTYPFYNHFFAGGIDSVRGFENNTLGPRSTPDPGDPDQGPDPFGGNLMTTGGVEFIFPAPFLTDKRSVRTLLFVDAGNVFNTDCPTSSVNCLEFDVGEIRYGAGFGLTWLSGLGPLTFSLAKALNEGDFDETEFFQFSFGTTF